MDNLEYLKSLKPLNIKSYDYNANTGKTTLSDLNQIEISLRKLKALEIIAEELCLLQDNFKNFAFPMYTVKSVLSPKELIKFCHGKGFRKQS